MLTFCIVYGVRTCHQRYHKVCKALSRSPSLFPTKVVQSNKSKSLAKYLYQSKRFNYKCSGHYHKQKLTFYIYLLNDVCSV